MSAPSHTGYRRHCEAPVSFVPVPYDPIYPIPEPMRRGLLLDVIHDGDVIPEEFLVGRDGSPIPDERFLQTYWDERDWGAAMVAEATARMLGLPGYLRIHIARVVMDFGRFPGMTRKDPGHLSRFAINYPFSELLGFQQKLRALEGYYDPMSAFYDRHIEPVVIKIAIHTYDKHNRSGTPRPLVSILTRANSYQQESEMPFGTFDPLFPDLLGEFTSDRMLRDRVSLTFEKAGVTVAHNYPYLLPDGSVEVRSQVWNYFRHLRQVFQAAHPETTANPAYEMVWKMLLDTNLRSATSEALRSHLHLYRRAPEEMREEFARAADAYNRVATWQRLHLEEIVSGYRRAPFRMSSLGLEVRKDLVWDFDGDRTPIAPRREDAEEIASTLARAIYTYMKVDREFIGPRPLER